MQMRTSSSAVAQALLSDRTYDIEFHGYLSNHAKHAIVALDKLGAPDERIQEYWDGYTKLTPYNLELHKVDTPWEDIAVTTGASPIMTHDDWNQFRGQKHHWQEMVKFLQNQEKNVDENKVSYQSLVQKYAPDLLPGIAGALTHGIIHLGWGIDAKNPWMTMEGLAYLNFCYLPMAPLESRAVNDESGAVASALRIAKQWHDEDLTKTWVEPTKQKYDETFHAELVPAGFQWHLAKVLNDAHPVATKLPSWLRDKPLPELWEELYRFVTTVYLSTRTPEEKHGNFVVLHMITSLWGLEHVCNIINDDDTTRMALEHFWASGICLLGASTIGFPTPEMLQSTVQEFPSDQTDPENYDWDPIVKRGCAETEEHNIKLVYVTKSLWNRFGRWKGFSEAANSFTVTPNIGPQKTSFE